VIDTRGDDVTRRWSLRLMAGLLTGAAVLSGCSEKQEANDSLPTASATPTEEELAPLGPEDLPMPAEARTQDAAGAEAFVRYYIELINRTSDVMDAGPLREFSDEGCEDCDRIVTRAEEAVAAGQDYEGGEITVRGTGEPLLRDDTAELAIRVDQARFTVLDASGVPTDGGSEAFSDVLGGVTLTWEHERETWLMAGMTFG
jgi:hypothetical protein